MSEKMEATALRRDLYGALTHVAATAEPIVITRHGEPVAQLDPIRAGVLVEVDPRRLARLCMRHGIVRLALFGSVLRADFGPESDVDVVVDAQGGLRTLRAFTAAVDDLTKLFGRRVDLYKRELTNLEPDEMKVLYAA